MTLPARRRGQVTFAIGIAALFSGALQAQQPSSSTAPAKSAAAKPDEGAKGSSSYSLGLMWGEQLRNSGVAPDAISTARITQGLRDGLTGKAEVSDKDRENIRGLATSAADGNHRAAARFLEENGKKPGIVTTKSGLQYQELKAGSGASPKANDSVVVNYRGTLLNGTEFDSSYKTGQPATFEVDHVIPGWTEALQLMKPGAKWKLFIPPQLAYDLRSRPPIPPGSMLIFEVELMSVTPAPAATIPALPPPATPPPAKNPPPK